MAHHKRRRPKTSRAGCLLCKPWKAKLLKGQRGQGPARDQRKTQPEPTVGLNLYGTVSRLRTYN